MENSRNGMIRLTINNVDILKKEGLERVILVEVQKDCFAPYNYVKINYRVIGQFINRMFIPENIGKPSVNDNPMYKNPLSEKERGNVLKILNGEW